MVKIDLIKAVHKAHNIIISCKTYEHIIVAENYISNFRELYETDEYINKLTQKLNEKKQELKLL
jgi:hypothetical protein